MSNISRRDFMKTAGVMTLAVAASGVLAGCSTAADEEVKPATSGSLTVGDYTVTVDAVKLYDYNSGKKDDTSANDAKSAARYLAFVVSAVASKDDAGEMADEDFAKILVSAKNVEDGDKTSIYKAAFGYDVTSVIKTVATSGHLASGTPVTTALNTYKYCYVVKVADYGYVDATTYKTPAVTLYTQDGADITGSISLTIPAVETIYKDSKVFDK